MTTGYAFALIGMVIGGIAIASQAPINARLGSVVGGSLAAAMISFGVGFVALFAINAMQRNLPGMETLRSVPLWVWSGGILGAYFVVMTTFSVSILGVVTMLAAMIFGQMVGGLLLDAVGAFGMPVREISWQRLAAVVLVGSGVLLSMQ